MKKTRTAFATDENHRDLDCDRPADAPLGAPESPPSASFEPVPVRARSDGWTPQKQREFIEALADTGLVREAAARVGMTEQSASRLRRRADAAAFDIAWEAALRQGARRLHSVAWERAIEGTVKPYFYQGEMKCEVRVFDNRLLAYLLGRTNAHRAPMSEADRALDDWEGWMKMIERGEPPPPPLPEPEPRKAKAKPRSLIWVEPGAELPEPQERGEPPRYLIWPDPT